MHPSGVPTGEPTPISASMPAFPDDIPTADIPVLSLRSLQAHDYQGSESKRMFDVCRTWGFLYLDLTGTGAASDDTDQNHSQRSAKKSDSGIRSDILSLVDEVYRLNKAAHDLPDEEKLQYRYSPPYQLFGFKEAGRNKVESGAPDRYEAWTLARDDVLETGFKEESRPQHPRPLAFENGANGMNVGSKNPAAKGDDLEERKQYDGAGKIRNPLAEYIRTVHSGIVEVVCAHLDAHLDLPMGTLSGLQRLDAASQTSLRLLRYLPHPAGDRRTSLLGHTDIGTMTVLATSAGGLQVLPPGVSKDEASWLYVQPRPGCLLVNMADAMVEWTGGIVRSGLHRVVAPPGDQANFTRYSVAYLVRPARDALMKPLEQGHIIPRTEAAGEGEKGESAEKIWTAIEWEWRKSQGIMSGRDVARSKGGIVLERQIPV